MLLPTYFAVRPMKGGFILLVKLFRCFALEKYATLKAGNIVSFQFRLFRLTGARQRGIHRMQNLQNVFSMSNKSEFGRRELPV